MEPASLNTDNLILKSGNPNINDLSVTRIEIPDFGEGVLSCWKPTVEELEEIQRTGRIYIIAIGRSQPPLFVTGFDPR